MIDVDIRKRDLDILTKFSLWWQERKNLKPTDSLIVKRLLEIPNTTHPDWFWRSKTTEKGYEYRSPEARVVAAAAGLSLSQAILGCVAASEFDMRYPQYALHGLSCVLNAAEASKITVERRVTMLGYGRFQAEGFFGRQSGRWCSSFQAPTLRSLACAEKALGYGSLRDISRGARRWVDLRVMDKGKQNGKAVKDGAALLKSWYREGWRWVGPVSSIDPYILCMLGREGESLVDAVDMLEDGRKRWKVDAR